MSVRSLRRDSPELDRIFVYFMRTILRLQQSGVERLPVENQLDEPYHAFLHLSMEVFLDSPPPELARLLLESEYDALLSRGPLPGSTVLGLQIIKELAWHIHYDEDCYAFLLSTENLWGNDALEYASLTFYPNLPDEVQNRYGIPDRIRAIPPERFRLNDF